MIKIMTFALIFFFYLKINKKNQGCRLPLASIGLKPSREKAARLERLEGPGEAKVISSLTYKPIQKGVKFFFFNFSSEQLETELKNQAAVFYFTSIILAEQPQPPFSFCPLV
jgi:hypothetical protein